MRGRTRRSARVAGIAVVCAAAACNSSGTVIQDAPLEMLVASGDAQFGVVGEIVGMPLRVMVRSEVTGSPREGLTILWDVTQGSASILGVSTTVTDSTGSTQVSISMGALPGEVQVRASVADQGGVSATFRLFAVNRPSLTRLSPPVAAPGESITITGRNFSPTADQNVVLFSGIRGRVLAASATVLEVEVPRCLPAREVDVSVQLGAVAPTASQPLSVSAGGETTPMQVGDVEDVADDEGFTCHALAGDTGAEYLLLAYSASAVGAASHPFQLTVLGSSASPVSPAPASSREWTLEPAAAGLQESWDQRLRELEGGLLAGREPLPRGARAEASVGPSRVPSVGERRTFNVYNGAGFDQVTAEARYVGAQAAIFVDDAAPPAGFGAEDLEEMAARFDEAIHPTVTGAFGATSDLDGNERVIILFTPTVNRLTPRGSSGFIGGFFYGIDLVTTNENGNGGEIFYALVPDPNGLFSDPHTTTQVLDDVPAVLAHEFQHMVHFNERVLVRGALGQGALWLSEGLAQMAEELVARTYDEQGDPDSGELFRAGARARARRYLAGPDSVSVAVTAGQGSLPERGAGFLMVLYLEDQLGLDVLRGLTQTTLTGVANVEAESGRDWADLLVDWWSAIYLDGPGPESGWLTYPTIDLRAWLGSTFPLVPPVVPGAGTTDSGTLPSSAVRYYIVRPLVGDTVSIRLGGDAGGPSPVQAALRWRLIRLS